MPVHNHYEERDMILGEDRSRLKEVCPKNKHDQEGKSVREIYRLVNVFEEYLKIVSLSFN